MILWLRQRKKRLLKLSDEAKNTALMMAFINNNKVYKQDFLKQEEDEAKRKAKREKEKEKREREEKVSLNDRL